MSQKMNKRIKELAEQAGLEFDSYDRYGLFDEEKLAELILQECLNNMENCNGDLDFAIWKTKQDFGVE